MEVLRGKDDVGKEVLEPWEVRRSQPRSWQRQEKVLQGSLMLCTEQQGEMIKYFFDTLHS